MKKLFAAVLLTTISSFAFAEPFSVSSSYDVAQTLSGAIGFSVDEGKTASFSGGYIKEFSVTVTPENEDQVTLTYHFVADTGDSQYETSSAVLTDLNKETVLTMNGQTFSFTVKRS